MTRFAPLFAVVALIAAPALAGTYSARTTVAQAPGKIIGRNISWTCGPDACQGTSDASRPVVLCQDLAKRAGPIVSFLADGRALGTADLAKCNTAAKRVAAPGLATAR